MAEFYRLLRETDVREYGEGYPVELVRCEGQMVIRSVNEGGNNDTFIDLFDLVEWLKFGPKSGRTSEGFEVIGTDSEQS